MHDSNIVSIGTSGKRHPNGMPNSNANMVDSVLASAAHILIWLILKTFSCVGTKDLISNIFSTAEFNLKYITKGALGWLSRWLSVQFLV